MAEGRREAMLIMMMSAPPLPTPKVVIWSATHITKSAAEVMPITVISWKPMPGVVTICTLPRPSLAGFIRTAAMPQDCTTQITIVR